MNLYTIVKNENANTFNIITEFKNLFCEKHDCTLL